jgi:hypothetical protein
MLIVKRDKLTSKKAKDSRLKPDPQNASGGENTTSHATICETLNSPKFLQIMTIIVGIMLINMALNNSPIIGLGSKRK